MIIILTQCFPSRVGGIETLVSNLAFGLSKNNKVVVFADQHNLIADSVYDNKIKNNFLVRRTAGLKFFRRRKKIRELEMLILTSKVDCVIAESWKSLELCIDLLKSKSIQTICLAHGNELILDKSKKINQINNVFNKCNHIITNSDYTFNLINRIGVNTAILKKIYPGVSNYENITSKKIEQVYGDPIILTLARLEKRKGHIFVLQAINNLKNKYKNIKYIIAGKGPELNNLKKEVKYMKLENNVAFLGEVNEEEKKYIFSKTDLMAMPTIDESENRSIEGFGIAYIESALFGITSIASNIGGTPEAVLHNKTGIIIDRIEDLENAITDLLINKEKRIALGAEAKKRALEEFQWENIITKYLSIIYNTK